jgi:hypothetical protein
VNQLVGYTNFDWDGDGDDRNSTSSYVFHLGFGPIMWSCKKYKDIYLLTIEVEYRGVIDADREVVWLCNLWERSKFLLRIQLQCDVIIKVPI